MSPRALALTLVLAACGCIFGSRPQLPGHDEDGGRTGGTAFSDASASSDAATATPPNNAADAAADRPSWDAARDVAGGRGCVDGDAGDASDAPDASDAVDATLPCHDGGLGARPALDVEVAP